jgi:hypothetical protein
MAYSDIFFSICESHHKYVRLLRWNPRHASNRRQLLAFEDQEDCEEREKVRKKVPEHKLRRSSIRRRGWRLVQVKFQQSLRSICQ